MAGFFIVETLNVTKDNVFDWDTTASNNTDVAGTGIAGSNAVSNFDDGLREVMAQLAEYLALVGGTKTSSGSSNAYTLTTGLSLGALADGQEVAFISNHANTGAATLAVDGLAAKAIRYPDTTALGTGSIQSGAYCRCVYDAGNEYWLFISTTTRPTISGGAIDGAVIGANTAAAITGTTVTASTRLQQPDGTVSAPGLRVGSSSSTGLFSSGDNSLRMTSNGTEIASARTDRFDLAIGRVKFPASQNASSDANTLDDYEEGTFTPGFSFGGGNTGIGFTTQTGSYTKIGNRVMFEIQLVFSAKGSATGAAVVTGLPFTPNVTAYLSCGVDNLAAGIGINPQATISSGSTTMAIEIAPTATGSRAALTDANFTNSTNLFISGQYRV